MKKLRVIQPAAKQDTRIALKEATHKIQVVNPPNLTRKDAWDITNGLSRPSKMPGFGYSIPAQACVTGAKLTQVEGSVCEGCYALRGNYGTPSVKMGLGKRLASLSDPRWIDAMVYLLGYYVDANDAFFRWHDSGDLQSVDHLRQIIAVCIRTPSVKHWLPTREYSMVREYLSSGGTIPDNLTIRLSAHMIDGAVPSKDGLPHSSVSTSDAVYPTAYQCPARHQDNACGACRACWAPDVAHVSYHKH